MPNGFRIPQPTIGGLLGFPDPGFQCDFVCRNGGGLINGFSAGTIAFEGASGVICLGSGVCEGILGAIGTGVLLYEAIHTAIQIYNKQSETRLIREIARKHCVDRRQLGDEIEAEKGQMDNIRQRGHAYSEQIEKIAKGLPKLPRCQP